MNFSKFLQNQFNDRGNVGEFSLVFVRDGLKLNPPTHTNQYGLWCLWVRKYGDSDAVKGFKAAWALYDKYQRMKVVSLAAYRNHKANRSPAEQAFDKLDRLSKLEE